MAHDILVIDKNSTLKIIALEILKTDSNLVFGCENWHNVIAIEENRGAESILGKDEFYVLMTAPDDRISYPILGKMGARPSPMIIAKFDLSYSDHEDSMPETIKITVYGEENYKMVEKWANAFMALVTKQVKLEKMFHPKYGYYA